MTIECDFKVGDKVEVFWSGPMPAPDWVHDWLNDELYVTGLNLDLNNEIDVTISQNWPPRTRGDNTDGFPLHSLRKL